MSWYIKIYSKDNKATRVILNGDPLIWNMSISNYVFQISSTKQALWLNVNKIEMSFGKTTSTFILQGPSFEMSTPS